jgi:glucosamine--fructose-6-phosphate aminotransferase (isomerizing)
MLKEIHEQPGVVRNLLAKLLEKANGHLRINLPERISQKLHKARRILIIACGTSFHAGLFGKYLLESIGLVSVSVEVASEFRYRHPVVDPDRDLAILITQSGETADTLSCLRLLKELGVPQIVLTNVEGSTAVREADDAMFLLAGPELGVASTKAFLAQIVYMMFFALDLGLKKPHPEHSNAHIYSILDEFFRIPALMDETLNLSPSIRELVKPFTHLPSTLFLGRGRDYPLALEGALKLKEISYIHAEGYPSGELKHGPLALVSDSMPVFALVSGSELLPKILGNLKEVHSRSGIIISIAPAALKGALSDVVNHQILLPPVGDFFLPLLSTVVLQFVSYHMADLKGYDVDRPRNLAKSVTVE